MHELRHRIVHVQVMRYMVHFWPENLMEGGRINKQTIYIYIFIFRIILRFSYLFFSSPSILTFLPHSPFLPPLSPSSPLSSFFASPPHSLSLHVNRECEKIREDSIQIRYRLKYLYKELQKSLSLLLTYWSPHCCNLHAPVGFKLFTIYCTLLGVSSMSYIILARCSNVWLMHPLSSFVVNLTHFVRTYRLIFIPKSRFARFSNHLEKLVTFKIFWKKRLMFSLSFRSKNRVESWFEIEYWSFADEYYFQYSLD